MKRRTFINSIGASLGAFALPIKPLLGAISPVTMNTQATAMAYINTAIAAESQKTTSAHILARHLGLDVKHIQSITTRLSQNPTFVASQKIALGSIPTNTSHPHPHGEGAIKDFAKDKIMNDPQSEDHDEPS